MNEKEEIIKFYYPYCKEEGCDGILSVKFNDDFSLDYSCDKNENHQKKRIFYKTFERFYLQEKKMQKCSKCHTDLESDKYKCLKCEDIYCCYCFKFDEHIKNDINNLFITKKRCLIHNKDLVQYCLDCKKNLCVFCAKDSTHTNPDDEHDIINLFDYIPPNYEFESLKQKIKKRKEGYIELFQNLNEWEIKVHNKIKELKKNLLYEIELMEKMFSNFNMYFLNYTYFKNFSYFINFMNNKKIKFNKCYSFSEFRDILDELFDISPINEPENEEIDIKEEFRINHGLIKKINDEYFFSYSPREEVEISYLDINGNLTKLGKTKIEFGRNIHSISISLTTNKIFACITNYRKVIIFNFDLKNKLMEQNKNEITDEEENEFNKCIEINDDHIATADNKYIIIWEKSVDSYIHKKKILLNIETNDLLLINDEYLVSSQSNAKTITFIDISNLKEDKIIKKIDSINNHNCLSLLRNYIIVNCKEGIAIILLETKELIAYIQNFLNINSKRLSTYYNDNNLYIYILYPLDYLNLGFKIFVMKLEENNFKLIKKYKYTTSDSDGNFDFIIMNENTIVIWGENIYIYKE